MPQLLLCSTVMQNIQIFYGGPVMFATTCFCYLSFIMSPGVVIKDRINRMHSKYFNVQLWPFQLSWFINSIYTTTHKAWIFEKFDFELEAFSCDFKIDCILVWQLISLNKKMVVSSGEFNVFTPWSPICTPLILVSASIKIANTS